MILYWCQWPEDGWQRGTVVRLCPRGAVSNVVAYTGHTWALRGTADTLLDASSYGVRWVLLSRAKPQTPCLVRPGSPSPLTRRLRLSALAGPPAPDFQLAQGTHYPAGTLGDIQAVR